MECMYQTGPERIMPCLQADQLICTAMELSGNQVHASQLEDTCCFGTPFCLLSMCPKGSARAAPPGLRSHLGPPSLRGLCPHHCSPG